MNLLACMLLLASTASVELLDETPTIAAGEWNYYAVGLHQQPARVKAIFDVRGASGEVKLALLTRAEERRLSQGKPHGVLVATPLAHKGAFSFRVPRTGDYVVVVDNREGRADVAVHVRVSLEFGPAGPEVITAAPSRQLTVVALSFVFFFTVVSYSARKILRAIGR